MLAPFLLLALSLLGLTGHVVLELDYLAKFDETFNIGNESNLPTVYQTLVFLACGIVMVLLSRRYQTEGSRFSWHWMLLGTTFLVLGIDESAMLHERFSTPVRAMLGTGGYLYYAWMVVWVPAALVIMAMMTPLLRHLPWRTARAFMLGGIIFMTGAVATELVQSKYASQGRQHTLEYEAVGQVQEFLELIGLAIFAAGLFTFAQGRLGPVVVSLAPHEGERAPTERR